ncbi:hypothetical protein HON22_05090 [Candidatus Peregrinibacteria bacterium]|jgi:hypothetical protein|nr:hypothetical protein [Candidatus Peregrinibacteria bacterium]
MKKYIEGLEDIFSELQDSNGENINKITEDIKGLKSYEIDQSINTDFFLSLILKKHTRTELQKILSMKDSVLVFNLRRNEFNVTINHILKDIKDVTSDTKRFKNIILDNGVHKKLHLTNKILFEEKKKVKRLRDIIRKLMIKLNSGKDN